MLQDTNISTQAIDIEPIQLIHEYSDTEFYIGTSISGSDVNALIWKIKKISKVGDVWNVTEFPDGDQSYKFAWNLRLTYLYK